MTKYIPKKRRKDKTFSITDFIFCDFYSFEYGCIHPFSNFDIEISIYLHLCNGKSNIPSFCPLVYLKREKEIIEISKKAKLKLN